MAPTLLPGIIGIAPELGVATSLAAVGPIVWAGTTLVVLLLAVQITRSNARPPISHPPAEPPLRDAA
jgi:hypothetical protein